MRKATLSMHVGTPATWDILKLILTVSKLNLYSKLATGTEHAFKQARPLQAVTTRQSMQWIHRYCESSILEDGRLPGKQSIIDRHPLACTGEVVEDWGTVHLIHEGCKRPCVLGAGSHSGSR
jgi:hypothetical protein